ncbi:sensor histidine kinase [Bremerella cremea]|uniref:Oxygen sensor histidine kinase NreB n=1 Tax=Bremerella cremea TaxID=1031537 RepID=A0A368KPR7_9BACT|nr:sensor histidine kinase [Bremerella cremea]RCS41500.1 sensor histidine kinase [Bremerella cremea]
MTTPSQARNYPVRPWRVSLTILLVVFLAEFVVMLLLPVLLRESRISWTDAIADAVLLTLILIPFLWFTTIRPLQRLALMRADLLETFVSLQEEERRRIAFDLHDEIGQSLTSVMMGLRTIGGHPDGVSDPQRLNDLRNIVNHAVHEVRRIANGLRPAALDHLGLEGALERMAEDLRQIHDLDVDLTLDVSDYAVLSVPVQTAVYRIIQEATTNVTRHAKADQVRVLVANRSSELLLEIEDNGAGLSNAAGTPESSGLGLTSISQRASLLGGQLVILSPPGGGTLLRVKLPVRQ